MATDIEKWKPEWREDKVMVSFLSVTQSYNIDKYEWKILGWVMLKAQSILDTKYRFPEDLRSLGDWIRNVRYASFTTIDLFGCKETEHQISIPASYLMRYDEEGMSATMKSSGHCAILPNKKSLKTKGLYMQNRVFMKSGV